VGGNNVISALATCDLHGRALVVWCCCIIYCCLTTSSHTTAHTTRRPPLHILQHRSVQISSSHMYMRMYVYPDPHIILRVRVYGLCVWAVGLIILAWKAATRLSTLPWLISHPRSITKCYHLCSLLKSSAFALNVSGLENDFIWVFTCGSNYYHKPSQLHFVAYN
jgi:hypothetical protein